MYFRYFVIICPWKRVGPFIWINLNPLHPRMLCAKFGWKWLSGSGEEDFLILSKYFRYFVIICPWKRTGPFIWIPFIKGCFVPSLVEIGPVVLGKNFLNFINAFSPFFFIIFVWKRTWPFIWTDLNLLHPRMLYAKFVWNWPSGSGERDENMKSFRRRTNGKFRSEKDWAFGLSELKKYSIKRTKGDVLPMFLGGYLIYICFYFLRAYIRICRFKYFVILLLKEYLVVYHYSSVV